MSADCEIEQALERERLLTMQFGSASPPTYRLDPNADAYASRVYGGRDYDHPLSHGRQVDEGTYPPNWNEISRQFGITTLD